MSDWSDLEITPRDAAALLKQRDDVLLLDCRTPEERRTAAINDSLFLPMQDIAERVEELTPYRDQTIIVYCHAGVRSQMVTRSLRQRGFADVRSMAGGIDRWSEEVDPTVPRY